MDIQQVIVKELQRLHDSETQMGKMLPLLANKAENPDLRKELQAHGASTLEHVRRLETVCQEFGCKPVGEPCKVTRTLFEETERALKNMPPSPVTDTYIIGAAQRAEHLEIASYGTAAEIADGMGKSKARDLFSQTLEEERREDTALTNLARSGINKAAFKQYSGQATLR
jgi:ferritin-like metal-binding protein YciE